MVTRSVNRTSARAHRGRELFVHQGLQRATHMARLCAARVNWDSTPRPAIRTSAIAPSQQKSKALWEWLQLVLHARAIKQTSARLAQNFTLTQETVAWKTQKLVIATMEWLSQAMLAISTMDTFVKVATLVSLCRHQRRASPTSALARRAMAWQQ